MGTPVATSPITVTHTPAGFFTATFNVSSPSSNGDHTVKATQGGNSASKTFTVTSSTVPTITLNPTSGPVGTSVNIIGSGFAPNSAVTISLAERTVTTTPVTVTPTPMEDFLLPS